MFAGESRNIRGRVIVKQSSCGPFRSPREIEIGSCHYASAGDRVSLFY